MSDETEIMDELIQKAIMRTIIKISSAGVDLGWPATNPAKQAILFYCIKHHNQLELKEQHGKQHKRH